jgi:hypothetical protein
MTYFVLSLMIFISITVLTFRNGFAISKSASHDLSQVWRLYDSKEKPRRRKRDSVFTVRAIDS